jgi:hypothetical protein
MGKTIIAGEFLENSKNLDKAVKAILMLILVLCTVR